MGRRAPDEVFCSLFTTRPGISRLSHTLLSAFCPSISSTTVFTQHATSFSPILTASDSFVTALVSVRQPPGTTSFFSDFTSSGAPATSVIQTVQRLFLSELVAIRTEHFSFCPSISSSSFPFSSHVHSGAADGVSGNFTSVTGSAFPPMEVSILRA
ncbi:MAG: hypothetical protein FD180_591 [Planctomycetota bacterium]|nr:MAG: hypothetical protein FD180_591 [Planctomycetota bacterium]